MLRSCFCTQSRAGPWLFLYSVGYRSICCSEQSALWDCITLSEKNRRAKLSYHCFKLPKSYIKGKKTWLNCSRLKAGCRGANTTPLLPLVIKLLKTQNRVQKKYIITKSKTAQRFMKPQNANRHAHREHFFFLSESVKLHTNKITVVIYLVKRCSFPAAADRKPQSGSVGEHCSVRKNNSEGG